MNIALIMLLHFSASVTFQIYDCISSWFIFPEPMPWGTKQVIQFKIWLYTVTDNSKAGICIGLFSINHFLTRNTLKITEHPTPIELIIPSLSKFHIWILSNINKKLRFFHKISRKEFCRLDWVTAYQHIYSYLPNLQIVARVM